jgi:hypothetical protein
LLRGANSWAGVWLMVLSTASAPLDQSLTADLIPVGSLLLCLNPFSSFRAEDKEMYVLLRVFMRMSRSSMARSVMTRCSRRTLDSDTRQSGKLPTNTPSLDSARICRTPTGWREEVSKGKGREQASVFETAYRFSGYERSPSGIRPGLISHSNPLSNLPSCLYFK